MVYTIIWGSLTQAGSLCSLRETVQWKQVDKQVKVFNVGDAFLVYFFKAHLRARICHLLKLKSPDDSIEHVKSLQWLKEKAESLLEDTLYPQRAEDQAYSFHWAMLHTCMLT